METRRNAVVLAEASAPYFTGGQIGDLVALADVKLELNLTETTDDAWLSKVISRASATATNYCKRKTFAQQLWQDHVWPGHDAYPWQLPPALERLQLSQWPIGVTPSTAGTPPPLAPVLGSVGGGNLAASSYYVRISYVTSSGETALSQETMLPVAAGRLPQVMAPLPDLFDLATGYNVYVGTASFQETLQNSSPVAMGQTWTLPSGGLIEGATMPTTMTVVETAPANPRPLAEGVDFLVDADAGQLIRLWWATGDARDWRCPVTAIYQAPFQAPPADLQDAVLQLVKARWFGRLVDPMVRSFSAPGVYEEQRWFGTGPGGPGDLPVDVAAKLDRYMVPTIA